MSHNTHSTLGHSAGCAGLRIADCGLRIDRPEIRNPKSEIRNRPSLRLGISLTEVLIAMGILTVGLLGVAAVFPVAGFYMQKGDVADRSSAIAQAAFNELASRGVFDPENWLMGDDGGSGRVRYTKSFKRGLQDEIVLQSAQLPLRRNQILNAKYGSIFVIDPLGIANSLDATNPLDLRLPRTIQSFPFSATSYPAQPSWSPWNWSAVSGAVPNTAPKWPMVRVTLPQVGATGAWPMSNTIADRLFRSSDDLGLDMPNRTDRPSLQPMNKTTIGGSQVALSRQSRGDYSWIATIVPTDANARDALATDSAAYNYEVSVAVFHKRIIDNLVTDTNGTAERITRAKVVSTGMSGGELLLEKIDTANDPFGALKTGNWVVVCGPHPASSDALPRFVLRWYRILSIEGKDQRLNSDGLLTPAAPATDPERRLVNLRGPQWPWQPASTGLRDYNHLSNNICVAIIPNVVAVHSKNIKLGGRSAWSVQ